MSKLSSLTDEQLERRVAKLNRRARRQNLQLQIARAFDSRTLWGKMSRPSQIRAGAKLLAARLVAHERRTAIAVAH